MPRKNRKQFNRSKPNGSWNKWGKATNDRRIDYSQLMKEIEKQKAAVAAVPAQ
ncbi:hypothetical protein [Ileibacterium valens]|uniref:hypothetical protein n=1 Tax=Ileibacterium valens TaxID=1862668 RepID=UPI0025704A95|nr:hypothetical protein [Ileibacterium valens]